VFRGGEPRRSTKFLPLSHPSTLPLSQPPTLPSFHPLPLRGRERGEGEERRGRRKRKRQRAPPKGSRRASRGPRKSFRRGFKRASEGPPKGFERASEELPKGSERASEGPPKSCGSLEGRGKGRGKGWGVAAFRLGCTGCGCCNGLEPCQHPARFAGPDVIFPKYIQFACVVCVCVCVAVCVLLWLPRTIPATVCFLVTVAGLPFHMSVAGSLYIGGVAGQCSRHCGSRFPMVA